MSGPKRAAMALLSRNAHINNWVYDTLTRKETERLASLIDEARNVDTIADPFSLLAVKRLFVEGNVRHTRNQNYANSHIYGYWHALFPFADMERPLATPAIEHGLILADDIYRDTLTTARCTVATFGSYRRDIIRRGSAQPVFCMGPYIQYADSFYPKERLEGERNSIGRALLVFPKHSVDTSDVKADVQSAVRQVCEAASGFSSVLVSVFWWNLDDPLVEAMKAEGFRIVSAGFRDDPSFVRRQRSIIELADEALSDGIGTHIGFCERLGVPVRLFERGMSSVVRQGEWEARRAVSVHKAEAEIVDALKVRGDRLESILEKYWGLGVRRTLRERRLICDISRDLLNATHGWAGRLDAAVGQLRSEYMANGEDEKLTLLVDATQGDSSCKGGDIA